MGIRVYPNIPRVYVDLDGVLFDYEKKAIELQIPVSKLKSLPGIYETLDPMPMASLAIDSFLDAGLDVFGLTKAPAENPSAASDKVRSIWRHFPKIGEKVIITPDKGCVGTSRDFLIDDHLDWANANNFPGTKVHFTDWASATAAVLLAHRSRVSS